MLRIRRAVCPAIDTRDRHDFGQLVIPLDGAISLVLHSRLISQSAHKGVWLPQTTWHQTVSATAPALVVDVSKAGLAEAGLPVLGRVRSFNLTAAAQDFCRYLAHLAASEHVMARPLCCHSLGLLGALIPEWAASEHNPLDVAYAELTQPLDTRPIAQIASQVYLWPSHFRRRFVARYGVAPRVIRSRARLYWLRRQLEETPRPIGDLARVLGYEQTSALTNFFQREMGCSPNAYRARFVNRTRD